MVKMNWEKFLRGLSGIDYLKHFSLIRIIFGLFLVGYGFGIYFLGNINEFSWRLSISSVFWTLGIMFILDGQTMLREYFRNKKYKI